MTDMNVFVSQVNADQVVSQLEKVLEVQLRRISSAKHTRFESDMGFFRIQVYEHGLINDRGIEFERFAIQINIGPLLGERYHDDVVVALAVYVASQMASHLKTNTMVTENIDDVVQVFEGCA